MLLCCAPIGSGGGGFGDLFMAVKAGLFTTILVVGTGCLYLLSEREAKLAENYLFRAEE